MKKIIKNAILTCLCIGILTMAPCSYGGDSGETRVTLQKDFQFTPASTDLFENMKGLVPGDRASQMIVIENQSEYRVNISLQSFGTTEDQKQVLGKLILTIYDEKGDIVSQGPADKPCQLSQSKVIGTFAPGASKNIIAVVSVPLDLEDEYQQALGMIRWQFQARDVGTINPVKTGDERNVEGPVLGILVAAIGLGLLRKRRKRDKSKVIDKQIITR